MLQSTLRFFSFWRFLEGSFCACSRAAVAVRGIDAHLLVLFTPLFDVSDLRTQWMDVIWCEHLEHVYRGAFFKLNSFVTVRLALYIIQQPANGQPPMDELSELVSQFTGTNNKR